MTDDRGADRESEPRNRFFEVDEFDRDSNEDGNQPVRFAPDHGA